MIGGWLAAILNLLGMGGGASTAAPPPTHRPIRWARRTRTPLIWRAPGS